MKTVVFKRLLLAVALCFASNILASAQKTIDNLANKYENDPKVDVVYTEERDPETKQIIRKSMVLRSEDAKKGQELWKAFEAERNNSVYIVKGPGKFVIRFMQKNSCSQYVLILNDGAWNLVIVQAPDEKSFINTEIKGGSVNFGKPLSLVSNSDSVSFVY